MTPFSVQNLFILCQDMYQVKERLLDLKYNFCIEFEKELSLEKSEYSEDVFDLVYNIHYHKRVFSKENFKTTSETILDFDFKNPVKVKEFTTDLYKELFLMNHKYFFDVFRFDSGDIKEMGRQFVNNISENHEKLIKYFE